MSEKKSNMLIVAFVLVIAGFTIATTVADAVGFIDTTGQHPTIVAVVEGAKWVAIAQPVVLILAFGRGLIGYFINYTREMRKGEEHAEYSLSWLGQTITQFEGWILIVTPFVNAIVTQLSDEKKVIAMSVTGGLWVLIDLVLSEVKHAIAETKPVPVPIPKPPS